MRNHCARNIEKKSSRMKHGGIMEEESLRRDHKGGIVEKASWRMSDGRGVIEEESWGGECRHGGI